MVSSSALKAFRSSLDVTEIFTLRGMHEQEEVKRVFTSILVGYQKFQRKLGSVPLLFGDIQTKLEGYFS